MGELQTTIRNIKTLVQQDDNGYPAMEAFTRMFLTYKKEIPNMPMPTTFPRSFFDLVKRTVTLARPGYEAFLKADSFHINYIQENSFYFGNYFIKKDFMIFFYFSDIDKGLLSFSRTRGPHYFIPLSYEQLKKGKVPPPVNINIFGKGGILDQVKPAWPVPNKREMEKKLQQLKKLTLESKSFSDTFNKFFDLTEAYPDYFSKGRTEKSEDLAMILARALGEIIGTDEKGFVRLNDMLMITLPQHSFVHGHLIYKGRMAAFFYFKDVRAGILAIMQGSSRTLYVRITETPLDEGLPPQKISLN